MYRLYWVQLYHKVWVRGTSIRWSATSAFELETSLFLHYYLTVFSPLRSFCLPKHIIAKSMAVETELNRTKTSFFPWFSSMGNIDTHVLNFAMRKKSYCLKIWPLFQYEIKVGFVVTNSVHIWLVIEGNFVLPGSLPHLIRWDLIWFYGTPSFRIVAHLQWVFAATGDAGFTIFMCQAQQIGSLYHKKCFSPSCFTVPVTREISAREEPSNLCPRRS